MRTMIYLVLVVLVEGCGHSDSAPLDASFHVSDKAEGPAAGVTVSQIPSPAPGARAVPNAGDTCYVDLVNGERIRPGGVEVTVHNRSLLSIAGWAVATPSGEKVDDVLVELSSADGTSTYDFPAQRTPRRDVVEDPRFRALNLDNPGFTVEAGASKMRPGSYRIRQITRRHDATTACLLGSAWTITLSD